MSDRAKWRATRAWEGLVPPDLSGVAGLRIEPLDTTPLAMLIVREGQESAFARLFGERLSCDVPATGKVAFAPQCTLVWSAPRQWLAVTTTGALDDLPGQFAGIAAITDQSDSRALLRVSGPKVREVLAKGFAIDLHPSAFTVGSAAITKVAHLSVQIWQVDATPTYMIVVPRSFASSFWSWLRGTCGLFATP